MSTTQSRTPNTCKIITTITDSRMEVGDDHHGFCVRISQMKEREWCNIGHRRPLDEIHIIPAYKDNQFGRKLANV
jgi:hypothetical protein